MPRRNIFTAASGYTEVVSLELSGPTYDNRLRLAADEDTPAQEFSIEHVENGWHRVGLTPRRAELCPDYLLARCR